MLCFWNIFSVIINENNLVTPNQYLLGNTLNPVQIHNETNTWNRIFALFSKFRLKNNNQQNYTEILNVTIFTNNLQRLFFLIIIRWERSFWTHPEITPNRGYAKSLKSTKTNIYKIGTARSPRLLEKARGEIK